MQLSFALQALLDRAGLRFAAEWAKLNTPYRAVLHDAARNGKLLTQTLLVLLRTGLVADGADLYDEIAVGACRCGWRHCCGRDGGGRYAS